MPWVAIPFLLHQREHLVIFDVQEQRDLLQSLRHAAFVSENESSVGNYSTERRHSLCAKEFRKLGFVVSSAQTL